MGRGEQEDKSVFCQKSISFTCVFTISTKYFQRPQNRHTPVLEGRNFHNTVFSKSEMLEDDSSVQKLHRHVLSLIHMTNYVFIYYHFQLVCSSLPYCSILRYDTLSTLRYSIFPSNAVSC